VTADEALSDDGEFAVTLSGGDTVPAKLVGRDPTIPLPELRQAPATIVPLGSCAGKGQGGLC
jgi:hypothetical protein